MLLGVGTMKANRQFTIRLANGREKTFDNASAMVEWMNRQRGLEYRGSRSRSKPDVRSQSRRMQANTNEAPLARYANRQSGEASTFVSAHFATARATGNELEEQTRPVRLSGGRQSLTLER